MRFALLKDNHRLERMRFRGLTGTRDEFHLAAIVQNLKTLSNHVWRPPAGQASSHVGARPYAEDLGGPGPHWRKLLAGAAFGFHFLGRALLLAVSGATGVGASLSMFGELLGGTVPEGSAFNACDG